MNLCDGLSRYVRTRRGWNASCLSVTQGKIRTNKRMHGNYSTLFLCGYTINLTNDA